MALGLEARIDRASQGGVQLSRSGLNGCQQIITCGNAGSIYLVCEAGGAAATATSSTNTMAQGRASLVVSMMIGSREVAFH